MNNPCLTFSEEGKLAAFPGARREPRMNIIRAMLPRIPGVLAWLVVLVLGAVAIAGCSGESAPGAQMPPPTVSVAPVLVKEVAHRDQFIGRVEDRNSKAPSIADIVKTDPCVADAIAESVARSPHHFSSARWPKAGVAEASRMAVTLTDRSMSTPSPGPPCASPLQSG